jgi:hypothetical protein
VRIASNSLRIVGLVIPLGLSSLPMGSCGGESETAEIAPPCDACAAGYKSCNSPRATESIALETTDLTSGGCRATIKAPGHGSWTIQCDPLQVCDQTGCTDADFNTGKFSWDSTTCYR